ncbi:MAG: hypothetical protein ACR2QF_05050 [Geminicoccaceae bacterium]
MEFELGLKVGSLTVIEFLGSRDQQKRWHCICKCGHKVEKTTKAINGAIRRKSDISCGCVALENVVRLGKSKRKHGLSGTRLESIRNSMVRRCTQPWRDNYRYYGGRGIKVCDDWKNDPKAFYDWALSNGYKENLSIERIDVDGNYEPSNCKFVPWEKQSANRRNNIKITFAGQTKCLTAWAREFGIRHHTLKARLNRGWSIERALMEPVAK